MRKSKILLPFFILCLISSGCYKMDKKEELNINFNDNKLSASYLRYYIDSILNKNIPDSIVSKFIGDESIFGPQERIIYFHTHPQEYFLIGFHATPCHIKRIYNKNLSEEASIAGKILGRRT